MEVKVKTLIKFNDLKEKVLREIGDEFVCQKERADFLVEKGAVKILEEVENELVEEEPKEGKKKNKKL